MARPAVPAASLTVLLMAFSSLVLLGLGLANERPGVLLLGVVLVVPTALLAWGLRAGGVRLGF